MIYPVMNEERGAILCEGVEVLIAEGCELRSIVVEVKPQRVLGTGELFICRKPTGAFLCQDAAGNTYWKENDESPWEKC